MNCTFFVSLCLPWPMIGKYNILYLVLLTSNKVWHTAKLKLRVMSTTVIFFIISLGVLSINNQNFTVYGEVRSWWTSYFYNICEKIQSSKQFVEVNTRMGHKHSNRLIRFIAEFYGHSETNGFDSFTHNVQINNTIVFPIIHTSNL